MRDGTHMEVSRDMKHVILEKHAETMYRYTAYPKEDHFHEVASALIAKHPSLKEAGSPTRYCGWKKSLKFDGKFPYKNEKVWNG